tara:strand:+ start:2985 stop:3131 length:147 start_codon:yes stop_codon:yes gene_type:complete
MDKTRVITGSIALVATTLLAYVAWNVYNSAKGSSATASVSCCAQKVEA